MAPWAATTVLPELPTAFETIESAKSVPPARWMGRGAPVLRTTTLETEPALTRRDEPSVSVPAPATVRPETEALALPRKMPRFPPQLTTAVAGLAGPITAVGVSMTASQLMFSVASAMRGMVAG